MDRTDPIEGGTIQKYDSWLDMTTTLPDVLSCDGQNVYMRSLPFDLQGRRRRLTHIARQTEPPHLFSPGFIAPIGRMAGPFPAAGSATSILGVTIRPADSW